MTATCYAIDLVTFDVGRTLLRFRPDLAAAYAEVLGEVGVSVSPEAISAALRAESRDTAGRHQATARPDHHVTFEEGDSRRRAFVVGVLQRAGVPDADFDDALTAVRASLDSSRMYVLYHDTLPALASLWDRGLKLGVISNNRPAIGRILMQFGLDAYLGFWVLSENVGYAKPARAIFEQALDIGAARPERALHVGDHLQEDYEGARDAGLQAVLLDRDGSAPVTDGEGRAIVKIERLTDLLLALG
ncbi:MAG TPA: HAD-IA family hydrolase [Thermomicrobiaceae bacterium]|nr:HAD-IA family hydrolase [Thermomicrobiaceae bacterium]